jgi:hypothetical protein
MSDNKRPDSRLVAHNAPEAIARYQMAKAVEDDPGNKTAKREARERRRSRSKIQAPEGVELSFTVYLRSDSTYLDIVQTFDGLREIRGSHLPFNMSANELVALLNDGKMPLGATDWHFMTREEIAEHKAAEEIETEPSEKGE